MHAFTNVSTSRLALYQPEDKQVDSIKKIFLSQFDVGLAHGYGDSFFDSIAQGLTAASIEIAGDKNQDGCKRLRILCDKYFKDHAKFTDNWVKDAISKEDVPLQDRKLLHLAFYQNHFVPLWLKKVTIEAPQAESKTYSLEVMGYKLHKRLYKGVSSCVYRAVRKKDEHPVIIKISAEKLLTEKKAQRFRREFELGRQIVSPYVVRYLELQQDPAYGIALIMDDDNAVELTSVIPSEGFSEHEFLELAIQIVQGLQAIHAANIVHNDLKISNILIQPQTRRIKIIDFNCASSLRQETQPAISTGQAVGTLAYISPEQTGRVNRSIDYRTDFYSLGVCFYLMLCGQLPFMAADAIGLIHQHLAKQPQALHQRKTTLALALSQLVMKLLAKQAENRYQSSEGILYDLNYCLTALSKTGTIPEFKLGQEDVSNKLILSQHLYGRENEINTLLNAPLVVAPEKQALFKILASIYGACYLAGSELYVASTLMSVSLSLASGHAPESCHSYSAYGLLLCGRFEEYVLGYQFGRLATQLAEKLQSPAQHCKSSMVMLGFIYPWSKPIQQLPDLLTAVYESGLACGELEYAGYCGGLIKIPMLFHIGAPLAKVQQEAWPSLQFAQNMNNQIATNTIQAIQRLLANLRGDTRDEWNFDVGTIDEAKFEQHCQQANSFYSLCIYHIFKAQAFYLYGHFKQALDNLTLAKKNLVFIRSEYATAIFNWYDSLTRLALCHTLSNENQQAYLQQITENQQQMQRWQTSCPENFTHKYCLVEAELARIKSNHEQAEKLYDQAIDLANRHGFMQENALAAELAAKYWLARDKPLCAQGYLNTAFADYKHWGAKRKLQLLKAQYPELLQALAPSGLSQLVINQETTLSGNILKFLDLSSILKASQAISSEIELPKLLHSMMQLIIENAGAQKGAVLFVEADDAIFVQAGYALDGTLTTLQKIPLADWTNGAHTVIHYVKRLHQSIVVDNATTHEQFKADPYITLTQAKSILCVPLLKQHALKALLYVENNLLSHAFTAERLQTVVILTAQMTISLENARYFAEQIALTKQLAQQSTRTQIAEASLHAVTHDLQLALQASKAGTWNWQLGTNIITWDAGNYALFGLTPAGFKSTYKAFLECVHPDDRERVQQNIKRCISQVIPFDIEYRVIWPDGSLHVIASQGRIYRDKSDHPIKMAGVCLDITQRKQLEREQLEALNKAAEEHIRREEALNYQQRQKEYTETMCHELRNPLQGLVGSTELLKTNMKALDADIASYQQTPTQESKAQLNTQVGSCKELVTNIEECTDHLCTLLDDALNLAKLEANKMELVLRVFQPKVLLQSVAKMFAAKAAEKQLQLCLQLPEEDIHIKGDAQRLKQVIINLLANALKFTEKGRITLGFHVLKATATHLRLQFTVADTGIGMTSTEKARLFQRFSQASVETASQYGGTGLGLAISDKLVKLMHGQITVESKKGEGTQFSLMIECEKPALQEVKTIEKLSAALPAATQPSAKKILVVDDNSINQKVLARMLQSLGYITHIVNNGKEAVEYFTEKGPVDLIFMDMEMPIMKGDETTIKIRQKEQASHLTPIPIICLTGHAEEKYKQQALTAGMNDILTKPFKKEHIQQIIETWLVPSPAKLASQASVFSP